MFDNMLSIWRGKTLNPTQHTPGGKALTDFILEVFRLNGRLLVAGDRVVSGLGLTSARWQVLGAIAFAQHPQPVSWLARDMGLNRQGVQRIVNEMKEDGLIDFAPNPHHKRAHLVVLSKAGRAAFEAATQAQIPWVNTLADGIEEQDIIAALRLAALVRKRLAPAEPGDAARTAGL